jgi:predicted nucleotidyltransferase
MELGMDIVSELRQIVEQLDREGVDYALCGGLAMAVYALPRATLDIDLLIRTDALESAERALEPLGYFMGTASLSFHQGKVRMTRLCKVDPQTREALTLDLLLVTPATSEAWSGRKEIAWEGGRLRVVSPEGLILLKSLRRSGTDEDDIAHLRSIVDEG